MEQGSQLNLRTNARYAVTGLIDVDMQLQRDRAVEFATWNLLGGKQYDVQEARSRASESAEWRSNAELFLMIRASLCETVVSAITRAL